MQLAKTAASEKTTWIVISAAKKEKILPFPRKVRPSEILIV